ncbi:MAG: MCE family protein [Gemmatimonadota bacterium]|nr:MCE family protein [Gemmatimonadota bacterium]
MLENFKRKLRLLPRVTPVILGLIGACGRGRADRTVNTMLTEARGLVEGDVVNYRGVEVGRVKRVALTEAGVQITLLITRADTPLRSADRIAVVRYGAFGATQLDIVPGPPTAALAANGATLAAAPPDTLSLKREDQLAAIVRAAFENLIDSSRKNPVAAAAKPSPPRTRP